MPASPKIDPRKEAKRAAKEAEEARARSELAGSLARKASQKQQGMSESTMVMIGFGVTALFLALVLMFKSPETNAAGGTDARALLSQGIALLSGEGATKDEVKGVELLKRSASLGHPEAQHRLGYIYTYGTETIEADPELAASYYLQASKQGIPDSMVNYGLALANGHGVEQNMEDAFKWWKKASNRGNPIATGNVGRCYESGIGTDIDLDKAAEYYKKGIMLEDPGSMFHMSVMYTKGVNQVKDVEKGLGLLKQAAEREFPLAMSTLGEIYFKGTLAPREPVTAMQLLSKAVQRRDVKAAYLIGLAHLSTEGFAEGSIVQKGEQNVFGVPYDPERAYSAMQAAAQQGSPEASYQLALLLEQGLGTTANPSEAFNWLYNAAKSGSGEAALELLNKDGSSAYGGQISLDEDEKEGMIKIALRSEEPEVKSAALKLWAAFNENKNAKEIVEETA